ncbi:hypothetical protein [Paraburkholderia rhynchosiae]|uniref:Uncharacterized protein n=1 Tax=Paraburkholderia rhynchosiae TaxID=487049 RepID=A0A2N7WNK0_9BURK|nr:hypothetical protein [Paraburkholderia rhynchosiae]PMS30964.1 hypothetical protein C0Z16_12075 [Paraburkholderia rhynchosiae]CAB3704512.1 hypothetical protein LMG27174_03863 [Paraburkholderia rhynchosiae]
MDSTLKFQLRITVSAELANALRADSSGAALAPLREILHRHHATVKCQYDAFADYANEAERLGAENYPLYQWTRDTIANPEKKAKYLRSFTVYVNGEQIYEKNIADAIETELLKLPTESGIESISKFDTNPANSPQPPTR